MMSPKNTVYLRILFAAVLLVGLLASLEGPSQDMPPKREFRAAWIATVNNIDWPRSSTAKPEVQMEEFRKILDQLQQSGINAIFVQVRPAADAFYLSKYEPWSEWISGKQGKAPTYDPLAFMIAETHLRNMELHAWVNPYRAVANIGRSNIHADHITNQRPDWMLDFGHLRLFNPGIPEARQYIVKVIADIVENYDVDGIHFDDYFYPYPSNEFKLQDDPTFKKYGQGFKYKDDWRRNNVNLLVQETHEAIHALKPWVKFGVSPYGVWRNADMSAYGSETKSGLTSYDHLYADVRLWLQKGWIDYVTPQLYQNTKHKGKPFRKLVAWWAYNSFERHLYIGHAVYRVLGEEEASSWHDLREMPSQVRYLRNFPKVSGSAFYSYNALMKNTGGFRDSLRTNLYKYTALIPQMPWKDPTPPHPPSDVKAIKAGDGVLLSWKKPVAAADGELPMRYVVYRFRKGTSMIVSDPRNILAILPASQNTFSDLSEGARKGQYIYMLTSLDRLHNESTPSFQYQPQDGSPELPVASNKNTDRPIELPPFSPRDLITDKHPVSFEQAAIFYRLAVESSRSYWGITGTSSKNE